MPFNYYSMHGFENGQARLGHAGGLLDARWMFVGLVGRKTEG